MRKLKLKAVYEYIAYMLKQQMVIHTVDLFCVDIMKSKNQWTQCW